MEEQNQCKISLVLETGSECTILADIDLQKKCEAVKKQLQKNGASPTLEPQKTNTVTPQ